MAEQISTGPKVASGKNLLEIFLTHHLANGSLRHQAMLNAKTKQEFGVDVPVLPLGNTFNVRQQASGAVGKLASFVLGSAIGAGGILLAHSPAETVEIAEDAYSYVVDFEWAEESQHTEETIDADREGSTSGGQ